MRSAGGRGAGDYDDAPRGGGPGAGGGGPRAAAGGAAGGARRAQVPLQLLPTWPSIKGCFPTKVEEKDEVEVQGQEYYNEVRLTLYVAFL